MRGGEGWYISFFSGEFFFYALPQFPAEKKCNPPPCKAQSSYDPPKLKDMTGIIKRYILVEKETIASSLWDFFNKQLFCKKRLHNVLIGSKI